MMLFGIMMMAFPEKLLAAYKVEGADGPMVKMMMSGMSMQFFGGCITTMVASRSSDKTISHVASANFLGFLVNAGYSMTLGMKKAEGAGVPTDGMYFNLAMSLFFAFINYQAHQDTGAEKPHIVKKSNNMVTLIRANMLCAIVFGLGCLFASDMMIANYMPGAPENALPFIKMMLPSMGLMMIQNAFRFGGLILSEDEDTQHGAVRAVMIWWGFQMMSVCKDKQLNGLIGNEKANEGFNFNFVLAFAFFFGSSRVLVAHDMKNGKRKAN